MSSFDADVRVEGVVTSLNTDVDNVIDSRIRFQVSLDDILVLDCRRISGVNAPESQGTSMSRCRVWGGPLATASNNDSWRSYYQQLCEK